MASKSPRCSQAGSSLRRGPSETAMTLPWPNDHGRVDAGVENPPLAERGIELDIELEGRVALGRQHS